MDINRRQALKLILAGSLSPLLPSLWWSPATASRLSDQCTGRLSIHNLHTNECLTCCYLTEEGTFDPEVLHQLNHLFRCRYTGKEHPISPDLFLLLDAIRSDLKAKDHPYELISGYRSPKFNKILMSWGQKVAKRSYHLQGMAADIRLDGVKPSVVRKAAMSLQMGGVGRYRTFVHLDVGPIRYW